MEQILGKSQTVEHSDFLGLRCLWLLQFAGSSILNAEDQTPVIFSASHSDQS